MCVFEWLSGLAVDYVQPVDEDGKGDQRQCYGKQSPFDGLFLIHFLYRQVDANTNRYEQAILPDKEGEGGNDRAEQEREIPVIFLTFEKEIGWNDEERKEGDVGNLSEEQKTRMDKLTIW